MVVLIKLFKEYFLFKRYMANVKVKSIRTAKKRYMLVLEYISGFVYFLLETLCKEI